MAYIPFTDALDAVNEYFPGVRPKQTLKSWGWSIVLESWEFRIEVESLNQNVSVRLMEAIELPRKGRTFLTRDVRTAIKSVGELQVALVDIRATLLGVALALVQLCGQDEGIVNGLPSKDPDQG